LGITVPKDSCAIHVDGQEPQVLEEGKLVTFDDCKKHEAWNSSDQTRVVLIFDMCNHGVRFGLDGLKDVEKTINEREITNEKNYDRKKLSLQTIETIKNHMLLNSVY
jgi:aspartyl/asparaginyl beta-hydroxylase (cupin superfamily)